VLVIVLKVISMDQMILDILQNSKHKHKFPPRDSIVQIKSKLAMTGNSRSGAAIKQITEAYSSSAESVLEEFTETVLRNLSSLGLNSQDRILEIIGEAFTNVIVEARGCALSEFPTEEFKKLALDHFNKKSPPILEQLQRKVRLKDLDFGGTMSSVQITGSQIGNLVLGSVNQSELTATVTEIVKQGGTEAELGQALQSMIEVVGKMDANNKAEQAELFDLLKGLLQQIKLPKQERSRSTIKAIWDRVVEVSQISNEVTQIVQTVLPMIPALLNR
jgi:hypothetical protein